jgi:ectoine hydroxylase-related dioxygenase (phytanoyl-CoA dioxygenase family)
MYDCGLDQGPLQVLPKSHQIDPMFTQCDHDGKWIGCLRDDDAEKLDASRAVALRGPAGSLAVLTCRMLHYSARNQSDLGRPLLLYTLTAADALPYTVNPIRSTRDQAIIRGKRAEWAHHDPRPCLMPPDWSGGYTSIFSLQQKEDRAAA